MTEQPSCKTESILCIRLSGLGDVVHALCALARLRRARPEAHVAWAVEDRFAGLLEGHPHVDDLIVVPRGAWRALMRNPLCWPRLLGKVRRESGRLRDAVFDASVDFQSSLKSTWIVRAARAPLRVGFGWGVNRELNLLWQNRRVRVESARVHRIERDLALMAPLGIEPAYADPVLPVSRADAEAVDRALGLPSANPLVVIHPGTSGFAAFKRWDPARYARVAAALVKERGARVVVTWSPSDRALAEALLAEASGGVVLAPPTSRLSQLTHLLARAGLFIGSDTGPMHVASAVGTPVVALFGPKDPVQTGPYCSRSIVVTSDAPCRPCTRRRCPDPRCMTGIAVEQVIRAAGAVLDGGGARRAPETDAPVPLARCSPAQRDESRRVWYH